MRLLTPRPPRVSLISAVYGVARYLPRFLDSLDAQVHPHDRLQVVLVLDGACDDSPSICRTWAAATDIDALVIEIDNGGQGRARNLALTRADGKQAERASLPRIRHSWTESWMAWGRRAASTLIVPF